MSNGINDIQISKSHEVLWCDGHTAQSKEQVGTRSGKLLQIRLPISGLHYIWVINESANVTHLLLQILHHF